jgi:hypothetical protein
MLLRGRQNLDTAWPGWVQNLQIMVCEKLKGAFCLQHAAHCHKHEVTRRATAPRRSDFSLESVGRKLVRWCVIGRVIRTFSPTLNGHFLLRIHLFLFSSCTMFGVRSTACKRAAVAASAATRVKSAVRCAVSIKF